MRKSIIRNVLATSALCVVATSAPAHEPPSGLLVHIPFDGSAAAQGRVGVGTEIVNADPNAPRGNLAYTNGYLGQAALMDGQNAVRVPFDINPDVYPQLTVTMWINTEYDQQSGYLFSNGAPEGPKLQYTKANLIAHGPRVLARLRGMIRPERWVFVAAVWDYNAGTLRLHADRRVEEVDFGGGFARRDPRSKPEFWIGTYNAKLQSTVRGVIIDDVRIYGRALSPEEILGLALGPAIEEKPQLGEPLEAPVDPDEPQLIEPPEEEPQLGEPPVPPEEESAPHEAPFDSGNESTPESEMHRDRSDTGTLPGEDPALDKLRRTQAPGGHSSEDVVRDVVGDKYEPGPTTDWEQVQEEAGKIDDEELEALREETAGDFNPGGDRLSEMVQEQLGGEDIPESSDFETRRQGLEEEPEPISGQGKAGVAGTLDVKPMEGGERYVRINSGNRADTAYSRGLKVDADDPVFDIDLETSALHTIEWFEKKHTPCKVIVYGYAPGTNALGGPNIASFGRDLCDGSANKRSKKSVSLLQDGAAITSLLLGTTSCEAGSGPLALPACPASFAHIKGMNVGGHAVTRFGTLGPERYEDSAERANFREWVDRVSCDNGFVATGVKIHLWYSNDGDKELKDMALICREVAD
ncbi:MAG: LamG domain-containing protein [Lysobacterales bacterium]|jgi:hypothetical protein